MELFVSNLPFKTTEEELTELFEEYGSVNSCKIVTDRESGRSRGFGFVGMERSDAEAAIAGLHGYSFHGRELVVNEARGKGDRPAPAISGR